MTITDMAKAFFVACEAGKGWDGCRAYPLKFESQFNALMLGMKKYSPPRSTLKVSIPWMRRLTGSFGIVNVARSSCRPMIGSAPTFPRVRPILHMHGNCWKQKSRAR